MSLELGLLNGFLKIMISTLITVLNAKNLQELQKLYNADFAGLIGDKMALSIVLTENGEVPNYNEETSINFDDHTNGDFSFIWPFIEKIEAETNQTIDLYDGCIFENGNLFKLKKELVIELSRIRSNPADSWDVHTATQIHPKKNRNI
jgi:hypothetical protein